MTHTINISRWILTLLGGAYGWFVATFQPSFPLAIVAIIFIFYDAWTSYKLDKRAKEKYPDRAGKQRGKFTSFAFGKTLRKTIPERLGLIVLAFIAETYVFIHVSIPLSYIVTGGILFEQGVSILENEASCRDDKDGRLWRMLKRILIDKTERHLDISVDEFKNKENDEKE